MMVFKIDASVKREMNLNFRFLPKITQNAFVVVETSTIPTR